MKLVVGENRRNPVKNLPRPRFVHHETHMEGPRRELGTPAVGGERLTACATRPPSVSINLEKLLRRDTPATSPARKCRCYAYTPGAFATKLPVLYMLP